MLHQLFLLPHDASHALEAAAAASIKDSHAQRDPRSNAFLVIAL
jgi:hypothetical protein